MAEDEGGEEEEAAFAEGTELPPEEFRRRILASREVRLERCTLKGITRVLVLQLICKNFSDSDPVLLDRCTQGNADTPRGLLASVATCTEAAFGTTAGSTTAVFSKGRCDGCVVLVLCLLCSFFWLMGRTYSIGNVNEGASLGSGIALDCGESIALEAVVSSAGWPFE